MAMRAILCLILSLFYPEANLEELANEGLKTVSTELQEFPHPLYQIYTAPNCDSFYLNDQADLIHWKKGTSRLIQEMCKGGSTAVDFGAHIGMQTMAMARSVGPSGLVIAVEPEKNLFCQLLFNLKLNGMLKFLDCSFPTMELSLRALRGDYMSNVVPLHISPKEFRLDSLALTNVSLIKFEKYEELILSGAEKTIRENKPVVFIKEGPIEKFEEFLSKYDYQFLHLYSEQYLAAPRK